ncbi:MAG TPA: hypothetical protein VK588_00720, partial [Chitinophagaceae bacterium]|nr:hypothetical protein [Chitinophagaceae bacterium]
MKFIFTAIAVLIASFLRSQAKPSTNKIDLTVGGKGSMNLPYDSAFTLSMHYKSVPTVFTTTLVRMRQRQGIVKALSSSKRVNTLEHEVVGDSLINVEFRYESRNKSGIIKPAQQYKLILLSGILSDIYKPESKTTVFEQFFDAININGTVDSNKLGKAISHYDQIYRDQVKNFKGLTTLGNALDAFKYYRDKIYYLDSLYHTQLASVKKNNDIAGLFAPKDLDDNKVHLRSIYQFAQCGTGPCKGVCWKKACSDSACSLLRTLKALWLFPDTLFNQINDGSIILTDILKAESQIKKASNVISEISYVDQTNQNLQEVLNWIAEIELENRGDSDNFCYRDINALKDIVVKYQRTLSVRKSSYNSLQSYQKKITTILINTSPMLFSGVDINDADSYVFDFQTRASLYITPIFGYAVFGFQKGFTDF